MSRQVALIVAVGQYEAATGLQKLSAPVNDANALHDLLRQYGSDFQPVLLPKGAKEGGSYYLRDAPVKIADFADSLKGILNNPQVETLLLYFSGHGTRHAPDALSAPQSYLTFSDNAHALSLNSLSQAIENAAHIKNIVLILDCCHSGATADFFSILRGGKRFCLIAAASDMAEASALKGHSLLTQIVLEGLNPETRDLDVIKASQLSEFVNDYPNKPPSFLPPSGYTYHSFILTKRAIVAAPTPAPQYKLNKAPYKGLQAFQEEDADIFFGRDSFIEELLQRLASQRFIAVLGASGSGKSSLVRAGLIPKLRQGHIHGKAWHIAHMRPQHDPLGILSYELHNLFPNIELDSTD